MVHDYGTSTYKREEGICFFLPSLDLFIPPVYLFLYRLYSRIWYTNEISIHMIENQQTVLNLWVVSIGRDHSECQTM